MKKILSLLLALALLLCLTGCQPSNCLEVPDTQQTTTAQTEETQQTVAVTDATGPENSELSETQAAKVEQPKPTEAPKEPEQTKPTQPQQTEPDQPEIQQTEPEQPEIQPPIEQPEEQPPIAPPEETEPPTQPAPQKSYTGKEEVARYIHEHGRLPDNFITKSQAKALGWRSGSLEKYAPGKCIGGDRFYNREGILPQGHTYYECDIDTLGRSSRGSKRIVFSTDGLIYYTSDHYRTFTLLYGEP